VNRRTVDAPPQRVIARRSAASCRSHTHTNRRGVAAWRSQLRSIAPKKLYIFRGWSLSGSGTAKRRRQDFGVPGPPQRVSLLHLSARLRIEKEKPTGLRSSPPAHSWEHDKTSAFTALHSQQEVSGAEHFFSSLRGGARGWRHGAVSTKLVSEEIPYRMRRVAKSEAQRLIEPHGSLENTGICWCSVQNLHRLVLKRRNGHAKAVNSAGLRPMEFHLLHLDLFFRNSTLTGKKTKKQHCSMAATSCNPL
jgi:hypothetical protein